jgi:hypothetical protein
MRESMREELTDDDLLALGRRPQPCERPTPQASTLERANMLMAQAVETAELRTRERDALASKVQRAITRIEQALASTDPTTHRDTLELVRDVLAPSNK